MILHTILLILVARASSAPANETYLAQRNSTGAFKCASSTGSDCPYHPIANCSKLITIQENDTLQSIAVKYGWRNASDLIPLNPNLNVNEKIYATGSLCVCGPAGCPQAILPASGRICPIVTWNPMRNCSKLYTIVSTDTCLSIAENNQFQQLEGLYNLNPGLNNDTCQNIKAGQSICVDCPPGLMSSATTTSTNGAGQAAVNPANPHPSAGAATTTTITSSSVAIATAMAALTDENKNAVPKPTENGLPTGGAAIAQNLQVSSSAPIIRTAFSMISLAAALLAYIS
ncbi:hypothetical protein SeMB42_g04998 [Synchytrium endobioticum]|uniref:LysM domain-containing protein n=1 Tax=Synchytrium endobioticum TaxID=286115 RepID=A0A507CUC3_9FUNG|nr:hypothetical protein SeMB42_g04998 [Synchytrium endobioticum]